MGGKTIVDDYLREVRPLFVDQRTVYRPGEICQFDGGQARIRAAGFPARKTIEEFDFAFQASLRRDTVLHLAQLDFLAGKENLVLWARVAALTAREPLAEASRRWSRSEPKRRRRVSRCRAPHVVEGLVAA